MHTVTSRNFGSFTPRRGVGADSWRSSGTRSNGSDSFIALRACGLRIEARQAEESRGSHKPAHLAFLRSTGATHG